VPIVMVAEAAVTGSGCEAQRLGLAGDSRLGVGRVMADEAAPGAAKRGKTGGSELAPGAQLHTFLVLWRERLDPQSIPWFAGSRRRRTTVSQADMAYLIGVSEKWYAKLERGERLNYSEDFLDRVAGGLRLTDDERNLLYLLAKGRPAKPQARPSTAAVSPSLARVIEAQPWPAMITDRAWDVLVFNAAMAEWFPGIVRDRNVVLWILGHPAARLQLVDYETVWVPRTFDLLRAAAAWWPGDRRLAHILNEALRVNPLARKLWEDSEPLVYLHPDGDHRKVHPPGKGDEEIEVEVVACVPMRADDLLITMLIPTAGQEPTS
jgi:transcriptional regulator with XRE-family HTH domain